MATVGHDLQPTRSGFRDDIHPVVYSGAMMDYNSNSTPYVITLDRTAAAAVRFCFLPPTFKLFLRSISKSDVAPTKSITAISHAMRHYTYILDFLKHTLDSIGLTPSSIQLSFEP